METPQLHKYGHMPATIGDLLRRAIKRPDAPASETAEPLPPKGKPIFRRSVLQRR